MMWWRPGYDEAGSPVSAALAAILFIVVAVFLLAVINLMPPNIKIAAEKAENAAVHNMTER